MKKILAMAAMLTLLVMLLSACQQTDVIGNASIESFEAVLNAMPSGITADEAQTGWVLSAPDASAQFFWSKDYSAGEPYDAKLTFAAQPFIDAGLDVGKLPDGMLTDGQITVGVSLGDEELKYTGEATPLKSLEQLVRLGRKHLGFHASLGHFGIDLGNGNMFEYAKDMGTTDKDIVFVLGPQTFIDAGVDPAKVEGWVFAKIQTMDSTGKPIEVEKFLKPFDLK